MRCISEELIQKFVDKETSEKENSLVQSHLTTCSKCDQAVKERRNTSNRIKELIGSLNRDEIHIPEFQEPENHKKILKIHIKKIVAIAAAACILISFLIFYQNPSNEIEYVYLYDVESDFNANLPLSEQEMVIKIIDSKGKLTKH
ncbi:MAG: zf-HC2 domain-containing protein [Bacteroidetes bacterium]|nr:zf-HC2 domain-containing protein [Bacteroidota bacterium]